MLSTGLHELEASSERTPIPDTEWKPLPVTYQGCTLQVQVLY